MSESGGAGEPGTSKSAEHLEAMSGSGGAGEPGTSKSAEHLQAMSEGGGAGEPGTSKVPESQGIQESTASSESEVHRPLSLSEGGGAGEPDTSESEVHQRSLSEGGGAGEPDTSEASGSRFRYQSRSASGSRFRYQSRSMPRTYLMSPVRVSKIAASGTLSWLGVLDQVSEEIYEDRSAVCVPFQGDAGLEETRVRPESDWLLHGAQQIQSTEPTHLTKILEEHKTSTADFSRKMKMENVFQLAYLAIGYFDHEGGSLSLDEYKVHLYIPRGALPKGSLQQVYIYVNPDAPPVDGIDSTHVALSPMVQCGPPGLTFLDSVVLSFPHFALEKSGWELSTQTCRDGGSTSKTWQSLNPYNDGIMVSTQDNQVIILMKHFTGVVLVGLLSPTSIKVMQVAAFGCPFEPCDKLYCFRLHIWNNDPIAKQKVVDMENEMDSKLLDVRREMIVHYGQGVAAEIKNIISSWGMATNTSQTQTIPRSRIWLLTSNSVTFTLARQHPHTDESPECDGYMSQPSTGETEGDETHVSIRPKPVKLRIGRETEDQKSTTCSKCLRDAAPQLCSACKEAVKTCAAPKPRKSAGGDYGGLSEAVVRVICEHLDTETDARGSLMRLAEELFGVGHELMGIAQCNVASPTREVMKIFFAQQRAAHHPDRKAVELLLKALDDGTFQILRDEVQREGHTIGRNLPNPQQVSSEIDDQKRFRSLAKKLGPEWEELGTVLGFTNAELYHIKVDNAEHEQNRIFAMLVKWRQRCGGLDEGILSRALKKIERLDLAQQFPGLK